ncbi:MAG: YeiH family protein [Gemmatimonadaceae bacterium]
MVAPQQSPAPALASSSAPVWASGRARSLIPGVLLSAAIGIVAYLLQSVETRWLGHAIFEALVIAIVLGMIVRTSWTPPAKWQSGIDFSAKQILELAIVLLGTSVNLPLLLRAGPVLLVGIAVTVVSGIVVGTILGRALGLETRHAVLVACGNAICGNSAIAAIAPVIGAKREHVASAIAFTAILGVVVILTLPLLIPVLHLSFYQYGVLAGMTVYAVPQVLAAAFPVSALSGEVGTLTKLVRVLLLGPIVLCFALFMRRRRADTAKADERQGFLARLNKFVPWFIIGFIVLAVARSVGLLGDAIATPLRSASTWLTIAAMAALGLGVDLRAMRRVGLPVVLTVTGSLVVIVVLSATVVLLFVHA